MRNVAGVFDDYRGKIDVVVNLLTTHGYWDKETDRKLFEQARELVKPNGLLVIHTASRDFLVKHFQVRDWSDIPDGRFMLMERRLNLEESRMYVTWNYYSRDGEDLMHLSTVDMDHLVYSLHELKGIITNGGWEFLACYGGFDLQEFTVDTFPMIIVAKNPEYGSFTP
jgi:SAM-dependent methyltransferase